MRPQKPATRGQFNVFVNGRFWMSTEGIATGKKPVLALRGLRPRCVDGSAIGPTIARRCVIPRRRKVTSVPHESVNKVRAAAISNVRRVARVGSPGGKPDASSGDVPANDCAVNGHQ